MAPDIVEPAFVRLIRKGQGLAQLLLDLDPTHPGAVQPGDSLAVTLGWLRTAMTSQYCATLILLANREYAIEAEILLRSLAEGLARVAWIHEGIGAPADQRAARCRALCLELGIARQREYEVTRKYIFDDDERRDHAALTAATLARVSELHSAAGCDCKGPTFAAEPLLREMAERQGSYGMASMLHWSWINGSGAAHNFAATRYYSENPDGTTQVGAPAKYGLRAFLLRLSVEVLCEAGQRILVVNGASDKDVERLRLWVAEYEEAPPLRNALRGELDPPLQVLTDVSAK